MELCAPYFRQAEQVRDFNQLKMLRAFAGNQMSATDMLGTTGYGLWDTAGPSWRPSLPRPWAARTRWCAASS